MTHELSWSDIRVLKAMKHRWRMTKICLVGFGLTVLFLVLCALIWGVAVGRV